MNRRLVTKVLVSRLLDILAADMRPLKLAMTTPSGVACLAFFAVTLGADPGNAAWAIEVVPAWGWFILFGCCTLVRFAGLFWKQNPFWVSVLHPIISMWLWSMLFASSLIFKRGEVLAALYLVPAFIEAWILASNLFYRRPKHVAT